MLVYGHFPGFCRHLSLQPLIRGCYSHLSGATLFPRLWGFVVFFAVLSSLRDLSSPAAAAAKSLQSCLILCDPIDSSPSGSPVPGILQARTPEWVAIPFSQCVKSENEVAQSCPTLCDPMDCSLPGSSAHGIFQARELEWVAIAFSALFPYQGLNQSPW